MITLLPVGGPSVRYSTLAQCWLVDDGSTVPQRAATWQVAIRVAVTNSISRTAGGTQRSRLDRGGFATTGGTGPDRSRSQRVAVTEGTAPASALPSKPTTHAGDGRPGLSAAVPPDTTDRPGAVDNIKNGAAA